MNIQRVNHNHTQLIGKENQIKESKPTVEKVQRKAFVDLSNQVQGPKQQQIQAPFIEKKNVLLKEEIKTVLLKKEEEIGLEDYFEDIYEYFKKHETKYLPKTDYMKYQTDISYTMRGTLIDWLVDVHLKFELSTETLYLCINIIDRFLSVKEISRSKLQLLGVTSLWIASKYEEIYLPDLEEFLDICANAYSKDEMIKMEKVVLETLNFNLTISSPITFLEKYLKMIEIDLNVKYSCLYLAELCFLEPSLISLKPSLIASCCLYLSLKFFKNLNYWSLEKETGYQLKDLDESVNIILKLLKNQSNLKAVMKKYSHQKRNQVSTLIQKYFI